MLSAEAVAALAPHLTIDGFAFDVELLYLARLAVFEIREVDIIRHCCQDSRVRVKLGVAAVVDVLRVRLHMRRAIIDTGASRAGSPATYRRGD